jgi:predicted GNAT family acetyltransferase
LNTFQADLAAGGRLARRYPPDLTSIAAIGRADEAALAELATLVTAGEWTSLPATLDGIPPLVRPPLQVAFTKTLVQMVCERPESAHSDRFDMSVLSVSDAPDMVALAELTHPGPFRRDTYRFGLYLGIRVAGVLVAMGGQRMHLPGYRELSAICTHPDFRGRGLARAIVLRLVDAIADEGLTPFLHVEEQNRSAQALYATLGFVERARLPLVVLERS